MLMVSLTLDGQAANHIAALLRQLLKVSSGRAVVVGDEPLLGQSGRWPMAANQAAKCWLPAVGGKSTLNVSFSPWRIHTIDPMLSLSFEESCRSTFEFSSRRRRSAGTVGWHVIQRKVDAWRPPEPMTQGQPPITND